MRVKVVRIGDEVTASKDSMAKAWGEAEKARAKVKELEGKLMGSKIEAYDQYMADFE